MDFSGKRLRYIDAGFASGVASGSLLFAGLTAWWYVSFMDSAAWLLVAWLAVLVAGVSAIVLLSGYLIGRITGYRMFALGALLAAWLLLGRFDFPRIGWAMAVVGGISGALAALLWSRRWRLISVIAAVAAVSGFVMWLSGGFATNSGIASAGMQDEGDGVTVFEYGAGDDAPVVDGSAYFKMERRIDKIVRDRIWGFDHTRLPLHGTLFYPAAGERLPLVAVLHGSHYMLDRSDRGYDYLARCLAAQGYAVLLVDQNFINKSFTGGYAPTDYIGRGWLLLKNLEYLRDMSRDEGSPLYGRIDFDKVALAGHSRGGDGIAAATWLNGLKESPAGNGEKYHIDFGIRGVVELAPTGLLTLPDGEPYKYNNVDYLLLHGDKDADVSFMYGLRRYNTVTYTDSMYHFKAAVNMAGANHGQFNTVWGADDRQPPASWLLDRNDMLPGDRQRHVAAEYILAFLDTSLKGGELPPIFRRGSVTGDIVQWHDSHCVDLAVFEEDSITDGVVEMTLRDRSRMPQLNRGLSIPAGGKYVLRLDSAVVMPPGSMLYFSMYSDDDAAVTVTVMNGDAAVVSDSVIIPAAPVRALSRHPHLLPIQGDGEKEQVLRTLGIAAGGADTLAVTAVSFSADGGNRSHVIIDNVGLRRHFER